MPSVPGEVFQEDKLTSPLAQCLDIFNNWEKLVPI